MRSLLWSDSYDCYTDQQCVAPKGAYFISSPEILLIYRTYGAGILLYLQYPRL